MLAQPANCFGISDTEILLGESSKGDVIESPLGDVTNDRMNEPRSSIINTALLAFKEQLQALSKKNLLPLDNDTIDFCVEAMRKQIEENPDTDPMAELEFRSDLLKKLHDGNVRDVPPVE